MANAASSPDERFAELTRAVELNPNDGPAIADLAWEHILRGHAAEALPLAQRALQIAPWSSSRADTLAMAYASLGRCSEAKQMELRSVDLLTGDLSKEERDERNRRAEELLAPSCEVLVPAMLEREVVKRKPTSSSSNATAAPAPP